MKRSIQLAFALFIFSTSFGQDKWDIRRCVDYALKNNISVRQTDLQSRFSELSYKQNKGGQLPSLNFGSSVGYRLGRSDNPTTGVLEDNNFLNVGMQLQSSVSLFNWFSQKNTIEASRLSWEADKEQTKKIQNDIALNVAVAYLQILLAREQANLSNVQVEQTKAQLENTRKRVDAGVLPELNAAELEAQLARDSSSLVTAEASVQQFLLQMKALLNLDAGASFDIVTPPVSLIPLEALADLQPDAVYAIAISTLPQQKVNELRIQSAKKTVAAAKAGLYPTISAFGSLSTNAISFKKAIYDQVLNGYSPSGARANAGGGTFYPIEIPNYVDGSNVVGYYKPGSITRQFNSNFGQSIGIGLNVPIFNGRVARTAWDRSKLTVQQFELQKEQGDMQLKQDIYKAYTDATAALQKFNADKKSVQAAEKAYDFASKRYELNLLSTYDLIISQNNVQRTRIQALYSQYDYVFKMKLLEFYKGQGIKL
ncbi:MAG: TolC family protein [Chitinophagaceae bacterium]|nr:TolC family protein [Chitinophagaceae bacterium]